MEFPPKLVIVPEDGHIYNPKYEKFILDWLFNINHGNMEAYI